MIQLFTLATFFSSGFSQSGHLDDWQASKMIGITSHGKWGDWWYCPEGTFAIKFQLKIEENKNDGDWTALNGMRFVCSDHKYDSPGAFPRKENGHQSSWGGFGTWRYPWMECNSGSFLTGMKMWSQVDQGNSDDSAANNIWGICDTPLGDSKVEKKTEIRDYKDFEWKGGKSGLKSDSDECPSGYAIAGFRTKVEPHCGACDDTAMNRVQFVCRKFPKCSYLAITDIKLSELNRRIPNAVDYANKNGQHFRKIEGTIDNCESGMPLTWTGKQHNSHERSVEESYSSSESWEKTMGQSMTSEVGVSVGYAIEPEFGLGMEAEFTWMTSKTRSFESTVSKSSEQAKSETVIKAKADETANSFEVPAYQKWGITTVIEAYTTSVDYTAKAQCYRSKAMKHKVGPLKDFKGRYTGVAVARETVLTSDMSGTCANRNSFSKKPAGCKCANVYEDHGWGMPQTGPTDRLMMRLILDRELLILDPKADSNYAINALVDSGVGGEECTDRAVFGGFKTKTGLSNRGTWCYVFAGTCKNEHTVTVDLDAGVDPAVFRWSKDPCMGVKARNRRLDDLIAPLY